MTSRQPHPLPVERGRGQRRGPRGTRPDADTIPHHECDVKGCGGTERPWTNLPLKLSALNADPLEQPLWFCSWGCLGRFAALREIRS